MAQLAHHTSGKKDSELTPAEEEYLETICRLTGEGKRIKVKNIAKSLRVKDPSAVEMLKKLKKKGLLRYDRTGVELTASGKEKGLKIVRRHKLAERLLKDVFKHQLPGVHEHACEFEHIVDDDLADKIDAMLGRPSTCPHGEPIPDRDGKITEQRGKPLTQLPEGENCMIKVIPEERDCVERLLSLKILPGEKAKVLEKLPRGAVLLQCGGTQVALSRDIASRIFVGRGHRFRHGRRFQGGTGYGRAETQT